MESIFGLNGSYINEAPKRGMSDLKGSMEISKEGEVKAAFYNEFENDSLREFNGFLENKNGIYELVLSSKNNNFIGALGVGRAIDTYFTLRKKDDSFEGNYVGDWRHLAKKVHYDPELGVAFCRPDLDTKIRGGPLELSVFQASKLF